MLEQYTVEIDFPHGKAYPLKDGRFTQNPNDENIEYWDSEPEAFSYGCLISQNGFIDFNVINMKNDKKCQIEGVL